MLTVNVLKGRAAPILLLLSQKLCLANIKETLVDRYSDTFNQLNQCLLFRIETGFSLRVFFCNSTAGSQRFRRCNLQTSSDQEQKREVRDVFCNCVAVDPLALSLPLN